MEDSKLNFIIVCDEASVSESNKKLNILGVVDNINAISFPAVAPKVSVVTKFEIKKGVHKELLIFKKDNLEIAKFETPFEKLENGKHQIIHNLINTVFPEKGEYRIEVFIDDKFIGFITINAKTN